MWILEILVFIVAFLIGFLPSILLYLAVFFALRFLFRRLPGRRTGLLLAALIAVAILAPYGPELLAYRRVKQWAASETVAHAPIQLTAQDSVAWNSFGCDEYCGEFLVKGGASAVVTQPPIGRGTPEMGPYIRWTLVRDPEFCGTDEAQVMFWKGARSHRALLAQGYCLRAEVATDDSATYRIARTSDYPDDLTAPGERFTQSVIDRDGNVLLRSATWAYDLFISPPLPVFMSRGITWVKHRFRGGPGFYEFMEQTFGLPYEYQAVLFGPILVDDPHAAVAKAARAPSVYTRMSALALICALGWERREESREEIALLQAPDDNRVQSTAKSLGDWHQGQRPCVLLGI